MAHVQGSNPEGAWWRVTARDAKMQIVYVSHRERNEADACKLAAVWSERGYTVEVESW